MSALWQVAPVWSADAALLVPTPTSDIIDGAGSKIIHLHFPGLFLDSVMDAKVGLTLSPSRTEFCGKWLRQAGFLQRQRLVC